MSTETTGLVHSTVRVFGKHNEYNATLKIPQGCYPLFIPHNATLHHFRLLLLLQPDQ